MLKSSLSSGSNSSRDKSCVEFISEVSWNNISSPGSRRRAHRATRRVKRRWKYEDGCFDTGKNRARCAVGAIRERNIIEMRNLEEYSDDGGWNSVSKFKINTPLNDSFEKSLYIAMLECYFELRGLMSPVTVEHEGEKYDFDFYQPGKKVLIKVFGALDENEVKRYAKLADENNVIYILDARDHVRRGQDGSMNINNLTREALIAARVLTPCIYLDNSIWVPNEDATDGDMWMQIIPPLWNNGFDAAMENMDEEDDEGWPHSLD